MTTTEKEAKQPKTLKDVNQIALEKAIEIGYGFMRNMDGTPIKVRQKEGYLGIKQFEALEGADNADAQPGKHDVALIESEDGRYMVQFPLSLRPIGEIRLQRVGGTLRTVQAPDMGSGDGDRLLGMALTRLNEIMAYARKAGVTSEIAKRIARNIFEGRWLARNYCDSIKITVTPDGAGKAPIDSEQVFAMEIEQVLFADAPDYHARKYTVTAEIKAVRGEQIYPSQQMTLGNGGIDEGYSRLYVIDREGGAMMTPQKIGHAIRTYDSWTVPSIDPEHPMASLPIPVSAVSGSHRRSGKGALSLMTAGEHIAKASTPTPDDYFVVANIVHGGLFTKEVPKDADGKKVTKKAGRKGEVIDQSTGEISKAA